jgi:coiled-coil domain-containing protein 130
VSGAKRKEETWDEQDSETMKLKDEDEAKKLAEDPFYRLEHQTEDVRKAKESAPSLLKLQEIKDDALDDYALNSALRLSFRVSVHAATVAVRAASTQYFSLSLSLQKRKKELAEEKKEREAKNLSITLLPSTETDRLMAQSAFAPDRTIKRRRTAIAPVFAGAKSKTTAKEDRLRALASNIFPKGKLPPATSPRTALGVSIVVKKGGSPSSGV